MSLSTRRAYFDLLRRKQRAYWTERVDADQSHPCRLWRSFDELLGRGRLPPPDIDATDMHRYLDDKVAGVRADVTGLVLINDRVKMIITMIMHYYFDNVTYCCCCSFGQGCSLLWTYTLRPFYNRPIALTQERRSLVNDVCECVRD